MADNTGAHFCCWIGIAALILVLGSPLLLGAVYVGTNRDIAQKAMNVVDQKHVEGLAGNCTPGAEDTVELEYDSGRWQLEASTAVFVANFVTSVLATTEKNETEDRNISTNFDPKYGPLDDQWLYEIVRNTVETDPDVIGSGICFGQYKYKNYKNFCPYASESNQDASHVMVKDLSIPNYFYTDQATEAEWWHGPRKKLQGRVKWMLLNLYVPANYNLHEPMRMLLRDFPVVTLADGYWTKPYYDCGGAYRWMITYVVPILAHGDTKRTFHYIGITSVDIDLSNIDINQCDAPSHDNTTDKPGSGVDALTDQFRGSHRCNNVSTFCQFVPGYGFRSGSYACVCKQGWYFNPAQKTNGIGIMVDGSWGFNGSYVEHEHYKSFGKEAFCCLKCAPGCNECIDDSQCLFSIDFHWRGGFLTGSIILVLLILVMGAFVIRYRYQHIVHTASIPFLLLLLVGLLINYGALYAEYVEATPFSCTFHRWMYHISTVLIIGALLLPIYRTAIVYETSRKMREKRTRQLSDKCLLLLMIGLVALVCIYLSVWTNQDFPRTEQIMYKSLKLSVCQTSFYAVPIYCFHGLFLAGGCYYAWKVRNIPASFNGNKLLFMCVCNMTIMKVGSIAFHYSVTDSNFNPDNVFVVSCIFLYCDHIAIIGLVYGIKVYAVARGKSGEEHKKSQEQRHRRTSSSFRTVAALAGYFENPSQRRRHSTGAGRTSDKSVDVREEISEDEAVTTPLSPHLHAERRNSEKAESFCASEIPQETAPTKEETVEVKEDTNAKEEETTEEQVELIAKHEDGTVTQEMTIADKHSDKPYLSHPGSNDNVSGSPNKSKRRGSAESLYRIWQRLKTSFDLGPRLSFHIPRPSARSHSGQRSQSAGNVYSVSFKPLSSSDVYDSGTVCTGQNTPSDHCRLSRIQFRDSGVGSALALTEHQEFLRNRKEQDPHGNIGSILSTTERIIQCAAKWKKYGDNNQPDTSVPKAEVPNSKAASCMHK